jgi:uncharacterized protein YchJ
MNWWNRKLKTSDRKRIETLSPKEQRKIFMDAEVDFSGISEGKAPDTPKPEPCAPCPCGSGKKFEQCCMLRLH